MKITPLVRNFIIFSIVLAAGVGALGYHTFKSSQQIRKSDLSVNHAQRVIMETQELISIVTQVIGYQRDFMVGKEDAQLRVYEDSKIHLSNQIASLRELSKDNVTQTTRFTELEHLTLQLKDALDTNVAKFRNTLEVPTLDDFGGVIQIRDNILRVTKEAMTHEYAILFGREKAVSSQINNYQIGIFIGGTITALIILIFNWYLLQAQSQISLAEASMKESEERMRLAIRGSNDGIFDWNFKTHQIYWSPQYKQMLGYEDEEIKGTEENFRKLLHPEDGESFWENFNNYINGSLSEFSAVYRMIHKSGRIVWINGRGKALFDESGQPLRFIGAHTDISYLKEHEKQLKEERDRAERASLAKGEFLAHMSHEIRTPLTAISGIAEIFSQSDLAEDTKHSKLVRTLKTSTETLKELITDILDFSKIESGEVELHNQKFVLGDLFQQVISIMSVRANEKMLDFSFNFDDMKNTMFFGDKQRLRQILINLVGNAIKFTETGHVRVSAVIEPVGDSHILRIDVQDTGIGIAASALPVIFEKFRQADSSVSRRYGGTGLGLPISKSLAEIMGGTLRVESEMGKGSTFSVILPFASSSEAAGVDIDEVLRMEKLNDRLKGLIGESRKIMIVEDYEGNIVVLSYILNALNCGFEVARTGLEAIQLWKSGRYDLILMDIQMPEMDGLTATRTIRKMEKEQGAEHTPIIGLTAHALVADKQKCIDSGMDDYLSKPIVEADLKVAILKLLDGAQTSGPSNKAA